MDKEHYGIIVLALIFIFAGIGGYYITKAFKNHKEPSIEIESSKKTQLEKLETVLKSIDDFKESTIEIDIENNSIMIDDTYEVKIKNNSYVMNVKDSNHEKTYCQIVDAIEQSKGQTAGKTKDTCENALKGIIGLSALTVDIYETSKTINQSIDEKISLYDISNSHKEKDLIKDDEINYNITIDNYILSSMSLTYDEVNKTHNIRGNIYNPQKIKSQKFIFKIYDKDKTPISQKEYTYENDTKKYKGLFIDIEVENNNAKYYSIEKVKK